MTSHPGENRLHAWLDDELDALSSADVERHLATCAQCAARADAIRSLSRIVRTEPLYFSAPPTLERQIRTALAREARIPAATRWLPITRRVAIAAAILLAVLIGWSLPHGQPTSALASEVLSAHLRSLMADHLLDVPSSDRHTVKPWFAGKVDFSPDVRDAAAEGFPLQGGRLEYIDHRPVAALVYRHDKHVINVFVCPTREPGPTPVGASVEGYQMLRWSANGLTYWAVSDASDATLRKLMNCLTRNG